MLRWQLVAAVVASGRRGRSSITAPIAAARNRAYGAGRAFRLHKLDGLSHAEVAAQLWISRSGVEKHIAVAMAHLRRALRTEV